MWLRSTWQCSRSLTSTKACTQEWADHYAAYRRTARAERRHRHHDALDSSIATQRNWTHNSVCCHIPNRTEKGGKSALANQFAVLSTASWNITGRLFCNRLRLQACDATADSRSIMLQKSNKKVHCWGHVVHRSCGWLCKHWYTESVFWHLSHVGKRSQSGPTCNKRDIHLWSLIHL